MEDQRLYLPVFDIYFSNSVVKLFILFDVGTLSVWTNSKL